MYLEHFLRRPRGNLILNGVPTNMTTEPALPDHHPRIRRLLRGRFRKPEDFFTLTTECRHGYHGKWEIKGSKLFLLSLSGYRVLIPEEALLANWFSGVVRVPCGRSVGDVFEEELQFEIKNGVIESSRVEDNRSMFREAERESRTLKVMMLSLEYGDVVDDCRWTTFKRLPRGRIGPDDEGCENGG